MFQKDGPVNSSHVQLPSTGSNEPRDLPPRAGAESAPFRCRKAECVDSVVIDVKGS